MARWTVTIAKRWPLLAWGLAVAVVWIVFHLAIGDRHDTTIRWLIAGTFALAALVMLVGTRQWTLRGLGIFGTVMGDIGLYGRVFLADEWIMPALRPWEIDLIRALFVVSTPLLLIGFGQWAGQRVVRWRNRRRYGVREFDRRSGTERRR